MYIQNHAWTSGRAEAGTGSSLKRLISRLKKSMLPFTIVLLMSQFQPSSPMSAADRSIVSNMQDNRRCTMYSSDITGGGTSR